MKTVAVIFGSRSAEHDVSIITALASIIKPLELSGNYRVEAIYISKDGSWYWDEKLKDIELYRSDGISDFVKKASKVHLLFDNGLTLVKSSQFAGRKMYLKIDVVFPATHGTHGEDGELMGLLEMAGVPYVGCSQEASTIAMDKVLAKQVTEQNDIASTPWVGLSSKDLSEDFSSALKKIDVLSYPLFVKPAHLGSSIGITKVTDKAQLNNALEVAAHYDDKIIVESGVNNLVEVTVPIIGNDDPVAAFVEQPTAKNDDFFDFDTKYLQGGKKGKNSKISGSNTQGYSTIPADLSKDIYEQAENMALSVYKAIGCSGISRIDLLIDSKTKKVYFNELNPLPGGLYAHNWRLKGISNVEIVEKLIDYAFEKFEHKKRLQTSFTTNYLKQF